jgi:hypothetical protein
MAVLARADASFVDTEAWVAEPGGGLESLRRMPATARVLAERPLLARLRAIVSAESMVNDGAARVYVRERTAQIRRILTEALAEGVRRKDLKADINPAARAAEIVAFMEGIQIEWILDPDAIDMVDAYESYVGSLLQQIAVPDRL